MADGIVASVGDVIITRSNVRPTPTHRSRRLGQKKTATAARPWPIQVRARHDLGSAGTTAAAGRRSGLPRRLCPHLDRLGCATTVRCSAARRLRRRQCQPPRPDPDRDPAAAAARACSPAAGPPMPASTFDSSATATPPPSSDPTRSRPARQTRPCSRLLPVTRRQSSPPSAFVRGPFGRPAARRRGGRCAQHYATASHVVSRTAPRTPSRRSWTKPRPVPPGLSPRRPLAQPLRAHLLRSPAGPGAPLRHPATSRRRTVAPAGDMAAVLSGGYKLTLPVPGPLALAPGCADAPVVPSQTTLADDPSSPTFAAHVQATPAEVTPRPVWAPPGGHRARPHRRNRSVWRAPSGIHPPGPRPNRRRRPTRNPPALWKQRLDRQIARATYPPPDARTDKRQTAHTAPRRRHDDRRRPYQKANGVRAGRPRPADSTRPRS